METCCHRDMLPWSHMYSYFGANVSGEQSRYGPGAVRGLGRGRDTSRGISWTVLYCMCYTCILPCVQIFVFHVSRQSLGITCFTSPWDALPSCIQPLTSVFFNSSTVLQNPLVQRRFLMNVVRKHVRIIIILVFTIFFLLPSLYCTLFPSFDTA